MIALGSETVMNRFTDLARRFPEDRSLMLVAESRARIIGGALAFRKADDPQQVILRIIAVDPDHRGRNLGRRLMEKIELEAAALGARGIALGVGSDEVAGFYLRLGYRGESVMTKQLPLPAE
ncbi:GNAT family N-acetyltransferase [Actinomadura formosensis]|uniref:GNAT family N-acetyltransferase n=1 Tax=Actinomadura formosensis TaxID=60706 RepID=UPI00082DFF37|nr:GNAT family N-acetyltransferase [Actinomadura formosensis]